MNYRHIYMLIIEHAKLEQKAGLRPKNNYQRKNFPGKYFEFHHILPKSIYPLWTKRKSNIVPLTAREHFFCHQLLIKIYPNSNLFLALWYLANDNQNKVCSSKYYQKLKERYHFSSSHKENSIKATKEHWRNPEKRASHIMKIKEARAKQSNLAYGKRSDISKKNISDGTKKAMQDPQIRKKLSENTKKSMQKPEVKLKLKENGKRWGSLVKQKSIKYKEYKLNGGKLSWNEFQKQYKFE
ncbi:MAG: hypothetical protein IKK93_00730 [Campylobacter sp.]|nr:hypothetical protein [Campylobacter sp.]